MGPMALMLLIHSQCRNAKRMPIDVMEALKAALMTEGKLSQSVADKLLKDLESCKRLQFETWN